MTRREWNPFIVWGAITPTLLLAGALCILWDDNNKLEPLITQPGHETRQRTEGLSVMVSAANRHQDSTAVPYPVVINRPDVDNFKLHVRNIARERGWYPHESNSRNIPLLVVPESDLHVLQEMQEDPASWAQRYSQPQPRPKGSL